jgi:hypothetical protein
VADRSAGDLAAQGRLFQVNEGIRTRAVGFCPATVAAVDIVLIDILAYEERELVEPLARLGF